MQTNLNDIINIHIPELESEWQKTFGGKQDIILEPVDELEYIKKFAFRANIIIEGDRGSGKTYDVTKYAKESKIEPVFLGGHNGIESIDLLVHLVPYSSSQAIKSESMEKISGNASDFLSDAEIIQNTQGNNTQQLIWKDGAVTEAFRKASSGQKTILVLDELLRIPQRELNILLTALSPIDDHYVLRTGRIISVKDGIANEETVRAPVRNLFVVATTNIGGQYAIDDIDPALAERFIVIRKDTNERQLKAVITKLIKNKSFEEKLINALVNFYVSMKNAKTQGFVENYPTTRTLCRAIELSEKSDDVWSYVEAQELLWIGRDIDGYPIPEQKESIKQIITKSKAT